MTTESGRELRQRLHQLGISESALEAAWPRWWSEEADGSASARVELHFAVARSLGFDPRSLIDARSEPRFIWRDARFKHLSGEDELERSGITAFGRAVGALLLRAHPAPEAGWSDEVTAGDLRELMLRGTDAVNLRALLALTWGIGIPVIHLRAFPWERKRMAAMTVRIGERWAILLGKESRYPAQLAFYVAHELGHVFLGHVGAGEQIVDLDDEDDAGVAEESAVDEEESAADAFALELLTGRPALEVLPARRVYASATELARTSIAAGRAQRIDPGTVVMIYGHSTQQWDRAMAALRILHPDAELLWPLINRYAVGELEMDELSVDGQDFLEAILGTIAG